MVPLGNAIGPHERDESMRSRWTRRVENGIEYCECEECYEPEQKQNHKHTESMSWGPVPKNAETRRRRAPTLTMRFSSSSYEYIGVTWRAEMLRQIRPSTPFGPVCGIGVMCGTGAHIRCCMCGLPIAAPAAFATAAAAATADG